MVQSVYSKIMLTQILLYQDLIGIDSDALEVDAPADERPTREGSEECSESDALSTSDSEQHTSSGLQSHWRGFIHMLIKTPKRLQTFQPLSLPKLTRRKSRSARHSMIPVIPPIDSNDVCFFKPSWKNFSLQELIEATKDFSEGKLDQLINTYVSTVFIFCFGHCLCSILTSLHFVFVKKI